MVGQQWSNSSFRPRFMLTASTATRSLRWVRKLLSNKQGVLKYALRSAFPASRVVNLLKTLPASVARLSGGISIMV